VSVENKRSDELDYCPHCERLLEIAAINLTLSGRNVALFICPNCGLARPALEPLSAAMRRLAIEQQRQPFGRRQQTDPACSVRRGTA
jgi:hypothetical protein